VKLKHRGEGVQIHEPVVIVRPESVSLADGVRIDASVKIEGARGISVGCGVHIASFCHVGISGGSVVIGNYANLSSGSKVISAVTRPATSRSMSAAAPHDWQDVDYRHTTIGAYACLFTNAVVLPGVTIGLGAVIAAGSVVTRDVPDWEIWAGVPARRMGERPLAIREQIVQRTRDPATDS